MTILDLIPQKQYLRVRPQFLGDGRQVTNVITDYVVSTVEFIGVDVKELTYYIFKHTKDLHLIRLTKEEVETEIRDEGELIIPPCYLKT